MALLNFIDIVASRARTLWATVIKNVANFAAQNMMKLTRKSGFLDYLHSAAVDEASKSCSEHWDHAVSQILRLNALAGSDAAPSEVSKLFNRTRSSLVDPMNHSLLQKVGANTILSAIPDLQQRVGATLIAPALAHYDWPVCLIIQTLNEAPALNLGAP